MEKQRKMGTKHSVPVTFAEDEGHHHHQPTMAQAAAAASPRSEPPSSSFGKLAINTAAIRPQDPGMSTPKSPQPLSALDLKITNALKELKRTRAQQADKDHNPFTRILLKAPLCAQALNSVRSTFEELDKGNKGYIVFSDIEAAFDRLDVNFTKEEIGQVFHESDMLENGRLTFKEFLVYLAIGFLLHKIPSLENERLSIFYAPMNKDKEKEEPVNQAILFGEGNKLRVAFQLAVDAFLWFDVDGSGQINRDEMAMRLGSSMHLHSPTKKMSIMKERTAPPSKDSESINSIISERRFNEMDWNHDGSIQFKEFLLAFESWVGIDDDDGSDC